MEARAWIEAENFYETGEYFGTRIIRRKFRWVGKKSDLARVTPYALGREHIELGESFKLGQLKLRIVGQQICPPFDYYVALNGPRAWWLRFLYILDQYTAPIKYRLILTACIWGLGRCGEPGSILTPRDIYFIDKMARWLGEIKVLFQRLIFRLFRCDFEQYFDRHQGLILAGNRPCKLYGLEGQIIRAYRYDGKGHQWFVGYVFYAYPKFQTLMFPKFQFRYLELI